MAPQPEPREIHPFSKDALAPEAFKDLRPRPLIEAELAAEDAESLPKGVAAAEDQFHHPQLPLNDLSDTATTAAVESHPSSQAASSAPVVPSAPPVPSAPAPAVDSSSQPTSPTS